MAKSNTNYQEQQNPFDDTEYGSPIADYPERDLEIINMQISFWKNIRDQRQEIADLAEMQLDKADSELAKLRAKQMLLKMQIEGEGMGHPKD